MSHVLLKKSKQPHRPRSRSPGPSVTPTRKLADVGHAAPAGSDASFTGRKLVVGDVNVPAERQADAIADRVMRTSPLEPIGATPPFAVSSAPTGESAKTSSSFLSHALNQQPSNGAPLPKTARAFLEPRLGTDLGHVRTHADAHATRLTQASNARAFAVGNDIFFAPGQFAANSEAGMRLLAHEVFHTLQAGAQDPTATLRRTPAKTRAWNDVQDKLTNPAVVALILIQELKNNPQSKLYVKYVMEAPEMMGFAISSAYFYKREVANNFFVEAQASLVKSLLTIDDDSPNKEGQWILNYMWKHKSPGINPRPEVEEQLNLYHGKLSAPAKAGIEDQNFPSSDEFPNFCMHAVLGNIEHACGEGASTEIQDRARQNRKAAVDAAKGDKAKEIAGRIANSQNLNAAVELGLARWVTKSSINESTCINSIEHTNNSKSKRDPFKPKNDDTNMFRSFYQPNPEQKILGAASLGSKGHYLFSSSVAGHHSVSLILKKKQNGPLALGSPDYQLFWNDQFDDDVVPQEDDDGTSSGTLGRPRRGTELMRWIFRFTAGRRKDPTNRKFWITNLDHTNYLNRAERGPETRKQIEDKAVERRCKNAIGIEIWQVVPK